MADTSTDPLIEAITKWVQSAPEPVRAMIASQSANVTTSKKAKSDVNYRPSDSPAESCSACANFDGDGGCSRVAGSIKPNYVSDEFTANSGGDSDSTSDTPDNSTSDPGSAEDGASESAE